MPNLEALVLPPAPIAADTTLLLAASSFIKPLSGRADPRSERAFDAVATAFCNGAQLYLPLPKADTEDIPILLGLWRRFGITQVPNLELSDSEYISAVEALSRPFAEFADGMPAQVASWIRFQFGPEVVDGHLRRSDCAPIERAGKVSRELLSSGSLASLETAILKLEAEKEPFKEPVEYTSLIGTPEISSFLHLCTAYALSVCVRGYSYLLNLSQLEARPSYRHHWIRTPIGRASKLASRCAKGEDPPAWFPWGTILLAVFDQETPLLSRSPSCVSETMEALRSNANKFRTTLATSSLQEASGKHPSRISDAEVFILDTLLEAGVSPRYSDKTKAEFLAALLRKLVSGLPGFVKVPVEYLTDNLQPSWARSIETKGRLLLRRDTFWDVFADPGIRRALKEKSDRKR